MNYTYKGKDYPKNIKLHHPEVETILSKDPLDITLREMNYLYDLPLESFTEDENNLILRELGRQQGKTLEGYNQLQFARLRWLHIYSSDVVLDV